MTVYRKHVFGSWDSMAASGTLVIFLPILEDLLRRSVKLLISGWIAGVKAILPLIFRFQKHTLKKKNEILTE